MAAKVEAVTAVCCTRCGVRSLADRCEAEDSAEVVLQFLRKSDPDFDPTISQLPSAVYAAGIRDTLRWVMGIDPDQRFQHYLDALGRIREDLRP